MKKIISLLLVAALLMSVCCITAFAEDKKPLNGPWSGSSFSGGARVFFSHLNSPETKYIFEKRESIVIDNDAMAGATYDLESNTLTINDLSAEDYALGIWYMGDDFKLCVKGSCSLADIRVMNFGNYYSTSLNIIGDGSLTVNEKKEQGSAISLYSDLIGNASRLNIASTVSLDLYASQDGEEPAKVVSFYSSGYDSADKAFAAGGKAVEGYKSERVIDTVYDTVKAAVPREIGGEVSYGYSCKSKSDPDGIYAANAQYRYDELYGYWVRRLLYVPEYDMYTNDNSYGDYGNGIDYGLDDFNKEFTFETEDVPKEILFTSEYNEEYGKGYNGVRLIKNDDPDGVYVGSPFGFEEPYSYDDPESYFIYRVTWDEAQGFYVEDTDFEEISVKISELEENGYKVVTEKAEQNKQFSFWDNPAPYDDANEYESKDQMKKADDPDGIYVKTFSYESTVEGEVVDSGVYVNKLVYDAENDTYYRNPDGDIRVSYSDFETDGWSFVTEIVDKKVELIYITDDYGFEDYAFHAHELSREDEPGAVYAYTTWSYDEETYYHDIYKLTLNEADGYYYCESDENGTHPIYEELTDEQIIEEGFTVVTDKQPARSIINGEVKCEEFDVYLDADSQSEYVCYYDGAVYKVDESRTIKNGDDDYFLVTECPDVEQSDLHQEPHERPYDLWSYWLEGEEYHFNGGASSGGCTVSGAVTSYLTDADVTVKLTGSDNDFTATVTGKEDYSIENVPAGEYVLSVEKVDHAAREYAVTVTDSDVTQDVKICPKGDVTQDGKTTQFDYVWALAYSRDLREFDDYQIKCGDVFGKGDGKVTIADANRIAQHARDLNPLYATED